MASLDQFRPAPPRLGVLALGVVVTLALSGCGSRDEDPTSQPGAPVSTATSVTTAAPSNEPTPSPTDPPTTPLAMPNPTELVDRLLDAAQVPGLNASWVWQDGTTEPASAEPFGQCAVVDLASIGAVEVIERTYFAPDDSDDYAAEQIASFPDSATAARAAAVLKGWHKKCRSTVGRPGTRVGPLTSVAVPEGSGSWYLLSYPEGRDEGRFHAFGTAVSGTRIAVLIIENGGQDYNYPAGSEPMVAMVQAAAARIR